MNETDELRYNNDNSIKISLLFALVHHIAYIYISDMVLTGGTEGHTSNRVYNNILYQSNALDRISFAHAIYNDNDTHLSISIYTLLN